MITKLVAIPQISHEKERSNGQDMRIDMGVNQLVNHRSWSSTLSSYICALRYCYHSRNRSTDRLLVVESWEWEELHVSSSICHVYVHVCVIMCLHIHTCICTCQSKSTWKKSNFAICLVNLSYQSPHNSSDLWLDVMSRTPIILWWI